MTNSAPTAALYLYLIEREGGYDENHSFLIAARNRTRARFIASQHAADEGMAPWLDSALSTAREIGVAGPGVAADEIIVQQFVGG